MLKERYEQMLLDLIEAHLPSDVEIIVYGSRADGTAYDTSDLDLALRSEDRTPIDLDTLVNFKTAVQRSNIPILVDIFDWARLPESFLPQIEAVGILLKRDIGKVVDSSK